MPYNLPTGSDTAFAGNFSYWDTINRFCGLSGAFLPAGLPGLFFICQQRV
jgi:hypothetical protein